MLVILMFNPSADASPGQPERRPSDVRVSPLLHQGGIHQVRLFCCHRLHGYSCSGRKRTKNGLLLCTKNIFATHSAVNAVIVLTLLDGGKTTQC